MKRLYTSKRNLCPICGNHHGCAIREDDLVECLRSTSQHDAPQGYRFLKLLRNGMGGLFALATDQRPEPQLQERQQQEKKAAAERAKGALPVPERDRAIRKLHSWFGLGSRHRQDLRDRGLSDTQIDAVPFFSVYPHQELPPGIPGNLPGVTRWGDKLYAKGTGYVCPSFDLEGRVNGWQIRYDDPMVAGGKYKWPVSPHLPSGELSITVAPPMGGVNRPGVCLAEGFLKPYIAAQKRGQIFIGSPNGLFAGSPKQTLAALEAYCVDRAVTLAPDAGDVCNRQVMQRWDDQIRWLQSQGYTVSVEWWGQVDKSYPDIDELIGTEAITYISPKEFLALGAHYSGYTPSIQELDACPDRTISRDDWELTFGFGKRLRNRIKQVLDGFKGFGEAPFPQPRQKEAPDKLFQNANQRLTTWQDAATQGYRYILDKSAPSLGKSHAAGIALPDAFDVQKLWYISPDHRNPTTGVIESNYVDLPVRHNGLKVDDTRQTSNGNPFLVWPKAGGEPDTQGNCFRSDLFQKFRAKNLNVEASDSSPICQTCKLTHLCKTGSGGKYAATFRGERKDALASDRIRAHADSLPSPLEFDYSTSGLFWDEIGIQLKPIGSVDVTLADFDQTWAELETKAPSLHEALKSLRFALRPLLSGDVKQPYHGWDDASIRALISEQPNDLSEIEDELERVLQPDLSFLENQPDTITASERQGLGISSGLQRLVNREFRKLAHEEFSQGFQKLALNWLVPFLKVWAGERGAFRCERQKLTIFTHRDRHAAVARTAKFNIFLDATINREKLALLLGINPEEIYVVEQEIPNHGNLKIIQITGMGKLGKERSESLQNRVAALRKALEERFPSIVFGDWKTHAQVGDAEWFVNLRGSNEFKVVPAMAVFGVPYQNVGYLQALYQTLTGDYAPLDKENPHEGLQQFIEGHTQAEIEQAVGRLRSHIRPNEQLTFIFVADYDLSFLGLPVEQVEAFQISPEAGTPTQISTWKIQEAMRFLQNQNQKITQQAVAARASISQPMVSKIAALFGGWKRLLKILLALLDPLYNASNNFSGLTDEERWLAQTYLPLVLNEPLEDAVQEVGLVIRVYGISAFLRILTAATPQTQARILALVMQALPISFQLELTAFAEGGG
jgi:hypothetical protein